MGDDGSRGIKVISDHFEGSASSVDSPQVRTPSTSQPRINNPSSWFCLFCISIAPIAIRGLGKNLEVVLTSAEVQSLRSTVAYLEEREAHLKAQLENVDQILRSAQLSGYLFIRSVLLYPRWATLPGEPPPLDDTEVDDWLPRFLVLHGSCIFFYLFSTDLSPQDSTLLSDITEVGPLPSFTREDGESRYCFHILTCHGLRYECSSASKVQVDLWLMTLQGDCKLGHERKAITDSRKT
ncbi:hypothetical protein RHGRI_006021 [Rhododendron griersonianum]|uniref:PH domain-containing protein n=1 Tax=Rhododendron griersonianum TaxID=479676 RepID=A0AAV6LHA2_9ERIC|nr:hypothetical protein RHGRI_006021 [Rhododendron griersonianum]